MDRPRPSFALVAIVKGQATVLGSFCNQNKSLRVGRTPCVPERGMRVDTRLTRRDGPGFMDNLPDQSLRCGGNRPPIGLELDVVDGPRL